MGLKQAGSEAKQVVRYEAAKNPLLPVPCQATCPRQKPVIVARNTHQESRDKPECVESDAGLLEREGRSP